MSGAIRREAGSLAKDNCDEPTVLCASLREVAQAHGDLFAVQDLARAPLTFSGLMDCLTAIRRMAVSAGLSPRDRVGIWIENRANAAIWIAALSDGLECFPLSSAMSPDQVRQAFEMLDLSALITDGGDGEVCGPALEACRTPRLVVAKGDGEWAWTLSGTIGPACDTYLETRPSDVAVFLMTSGSTGAPKLVPVTHEAITLTTRRAAARLELQPGERALNVMQLNHVHGLVSGVFLPWISAGCSVMPGEYNSRSFLDWHQTARPHWFSTSPAIFSDVLRRAAASGADIRLPELRFVRCGSAALTPALRRKIEETFDVPLLEAYGMSEALQIAGVPFGDPRRETVGLPVADEVGIFDGDAQLSEANATGEIRVRGRTVMPHYVGEAAHAPDRQNGWFSTGDLGYLDSSGFLHVTGRLGDRLNIGGEMVAPAEVESALLQIDGVEECVCFRNPHEVLGDAICAAVVRTPPSTLDSDAVRRAARRFLPVGKIPSRIFFADALPMDQNGKHNRAKIAAMFAGEDEAAVEARPSDMDPLESWLAEAFCRALRRASVSADGDFFEMGGTSLDAVELLLGLEEKLGETIHVPALFNAPTVRKLADFLTREYPDAVNALTGRKPAPKAATPAADHDKTQEFLTSLPEFDGAGLGSSKTSPVFILSAPRCGSTLLRVMLAGHDGVFSPPEMRLLRFRRMDEWANAHDGQFRFFRDGLAQALMSAKNCDEPQARDWLDRAAKRQTPVETVYDHLQSLVGGRVLVDKTPGYALNLDVLRSMRKRFKAPRFIILRRNPAAMQRSFVEGRMDQVWMHEWGHSADELADLIWWRSYRNIEDFAQSLNLRDVMRLNFEDLVADPARSMEKVCRFIGLPFNESVLDPYGDRDKQMTRGVRGASAMIGDPKFFRHSAIDASRAGSGFLVPKEAELSAQTRDLAAELGYVGDANAAPEPRIVKNLRRMAVDWGDSGEGRDDLIFSVNSIGANVPIFWVCQLDEEGRRLADALGSTQPLYYMRSADRIVSRFDCGVTEIARAYAERITAIHPTGPLVLGGNCQGADVAREIIRILASEGRSVEMLFAIDTEFETPLDVHMAHFFGAQSHRNPFRSKVQSRYPWFRQLNPIRKRPKAPPSPVNPTDRWSKLYPSHSVDVLPCAHGEYFTPETVPILAERIKFRAREILDRQR